MISGPKMLYKRTKKRGAQGKDGKDFVTSRLREKYNTKTKRASINTFSANGLRGKKIGHESNLCEALSHCFTERKQKKQAMVLRLEVKDERMLPVCTTQ